MKFLLLWLRWPTTRQAGNLKAELITLGCVERARPTGDQHIVVIWGRVFENDLLRLFPWFGRKAKNSKRLSGTVHIQVIVRRQALQMNLECGRHRHKEAEPIQVSTGIYEEAQIGVHR